MSTFINAPKIPPLPPDKQRELFIADALWTTAAIIGTIILHTFTWALLAIAF